MLLHTHTHTHTHTALKARDGTRIVEREREEEREERERESKRESEREREREDTPAGTSKVPRQRVGLYSSNASAPTRDVSTTCMRGGAQFTCFTGTKVQILTLRTRGKITLSRGRPLRRCDLTGA